jgi:hypothetical protein
MKEFLNELARLWWIEVGTNLTNPISEQSINGLRTILKEEYNFDSEVIEYIIESAVKTPTNFHLGGNRESGMQVGTNDTAVSAHLHSDEDDDLDGAIDYDEPIEEEETDEKEDSKDEERPDGGDDKEKVIKDLSKNALTAYEKDKLKKEDVYVKNKKSGSVYTVKKPNPETHIKPSKGEVDNAKEDDKSDKSSDDGKKNTTNSPKEVEKIFNGSQSSVRDGLLYMSDDDKKLFDNFKDDFTKLSSSPSKEIAQQMVDKYGLTISSNGKKVYMRNINFEARKILGANKATQFIKDTVENSLGEPLKGASKGVDVKQAVTTTSKPDLETKRTATEDKNVKQLFSKSPYDRLNPNFHQVFGPTDKSGNLVYPSGGKNSKAFLQQSLDENNSIRKTINKLEELEKTENVSPKVRQSLEQHQKNMENIIKTMKIPSKQAAQAIGDSYAVMAESINTESPTLAGAMMKNLAEFALYDTEVANGEEVYLPSDGSFPSGDKLKVTRDGGKVERVASVSVKYGRSGKYGSFGFPGETGQYQKYHPDTEYRDRLHSRPGDDGYDIGVKNEIIRDDEKMNKIVDESGLGDAIKDRDKLFSVIRENLDEIEKLKKEIDYEQKPKRSSGKPPAWKQLNVKKKEILALEENLAKKMEEHIDSDKLESIVGNDNAKIMMKNPASMVSALTFVSTLKTSNGLDVIEHNHQEIKDGKYESHTDTAEDGTDNPKNWKFTWRAYDSRAGGLIASFNSDRKDM